jgi:hypothetical protein
MNNGIPPPDNGLNNFDIANDVSADTFFLDFLLTLYSSTSMVSNLQTTDLRMSSKTLILIPSYIKMGTVLETLTLMHPIS